MVVNPAVPAKTVPEFIAYAKANPGKIVMASVGNGTTPHLAGELFKLMARVDLLHVPYQGAAPALTDLLGGRADVMFEAMPTLVGYIKSRQAAGAGRWAPRRARRCFRICPPLASSCPATRRPSGSASRAARRRRPRSSSGSTRKSTPVSTILRCARASSMSAACRSSARTADFEKLFVDDAQKWAKVMREANIKPE